MTPILWLLGILGFYLLTCRATDPGTLGAFNDFMAATRQRPLSGPDTVANQMTLQRKYMSRKMMSGLTSEEYFQDGTEIIEFVQLAYTANARNYLPTDDQAYTGENSLTSIKAPWRFKLVDSMWYDHEIILNTGDQATVFKRLMKVKRQKMFTDLWDKMEIDYWALPNATQMEGGNTNGRDPYSLLSFNTRDGLAPSSTNGGIAAATSNWTTVHQASPTNYSNWVNQVATYDSSDIDANLEDALNEMWLLVQFEAPDDSNKTGMTDTALSKYMITTNREGYKVLMRLVKNNTSNPTPQTSLGWAAGKITINGMRVDYVSAMDSTSICPAGKPDFMFWNFKHIHPIFHKTRYLFPKSFEGTPKQPMANVELRDTWHNLFCTNRREQGRVSAA